MGYRRMRCEMKFALAMQNDHVHTNYQVCWEFVYDH